MDILPGLIFLLVVAGVVVGFVIRWLASVAPLDVGTPMRMGMTKCTTCWKWSRSRRFELASVTQDETLGTEVVVTDRMCPKCGALVRFPPTDEGPLLVVAMKRRMGLRCPNCGKLEWRSAFANKTVSIAEGYLRRSMSGFSTRTADYRHESCDYSWRKIYTHRESSGWG